MSQPAFPEPPRACVEGIHLPDVHPFNVPWEQHISNIRKLAVRKDDVFLCAFPKAGTHWLWEVMIMLHAGKVAYEPRAKDHLMMEFTTVENMDAEPSPRIFNTHLPFSMLPVEQIKAKGAKVVHMYRNPKDTVVSMWFHYRQLPFLADISVRDFLQFFIEDKLIFGTWAAHLKQVQKFAKGNPDYEIFNVSFEETKQNPVAVIKRLARYLGLNPDDQLCEDIAEACSFHKMKQISDSKMVPEGTAFSLDQQIYRKGEVGDWKNHLTVADSELIDQAFADDLKDVDMFNIAYTI